jgi:hypothetical protein
VSANSVAPFCVRPAPSDGANTPSVLAGKSANPPPMLANMQDKSKREYSAILSPVSKDNFVSETVQAKRNCQQHARHGVYRKSQPPRRFGTGHHISPLAKTNRMTLVDHKNKKCCSKILRKQNSSGTGCTFQVVMVECEL